MRKLAVIIIVLAFLFAGDFMARAELFGIGGGLSTYFLDISNLEESIEDLPEDLPNWCPVPIIQGRIHLLAPLIFVDTFRLEAGGLAMNLIISDIFNIPDVTLHFDFQTTVFSASLLKQFNLPFIGVYLGLGGDLINGRATMSSPDSPDVPEVTISWSATTIHGLGGAHLILGLVRFYLEGKALHPVIQNYSDDVDIFLIPWQVSTGLMLSF